MTLAKGLVDLSCPSLSEVWKCLEHIELYTMIPIDLKGSIDLSSYKHIYIVHYTSIYCNIL